MINPDFFDRTEFLLESAGVLASAKCIVNLPEKILWRYKLDNGYSLSIYQEDSPLYDDGVGHMVIFDLKGDIENTYLQERIGDSEMIVRPINARDVAVAFSRYMEEANGRSE